MNIWPDFIFIALGLLSIKIKAYSPDKAYHVCRLEARLGVGLIVSSCEDVGKETSVYMKIRIPCEGKAVTLSLVGGKKTNNNKKDSKERI